MLAPQCCISLFPTVKIMESPTGAQTYLAHTRIGGEMEIAVGTKVVVNGVKCFLKNAMAKRWITGKRRGDGSMPKICRDMFKAIVDDRVGRNEISNGRS